MKSSTSRRQFVKGTLLGAGGFIFLQRCSLETNEWKYLTNREGEVLESIAEQFIPTDQNPGAREACVVNFIDTQLTRHYIRFQKRYRDGIKSFQSTCKQDMGKSFLHLQTADQIGFLEKMEQGSVSETFWKEDTPRSFFNLVLQHCMQGFYGDPRHGGNCNHVSYQMIGLRVIQFYQPENAAAS